MVRTYWEFSPVNKKEETFYVFQLLYVTLNTLIALQVIEIGTIYFYGGIIESIKYYVKHYIKQNTMFYCS